MFNFTRPVSAVPNFDPSSITRPDAALLRYYFLLALLTGPFFPFIFLPLFFKFETLRYHFDESGVSMSWGLLFRRETYLTYRRIQDIHLTRNIIQRWMGLATLSVQTASGSATPEMSIEGIRAADALRDYLYVKMRGAKGERETETEADSSSEAWAAEPSADQSLTLLREIRDALRELAERGTTT